MTGRLTKDPEGRTTQSGISQSTFTLAVQRRFRNADGNYDADFLNVVAWRQTADFCNNYLTKGRLVAVEGSIQTRSYDAQDGSRRYVTEIIADHVEGLTRAEEAPREAEKPAQQSGKEDFEEVDPGDELPF